MIAMEYEKMMDKLIKKCGLAYVDAMRGYITKEKCNEIVNKVMSMSYTSNDPDYGKNAVYDKIMNEINMWKEVLAA